MSLLFLKKVKLVFLLILNSFIYSNEVTFNKNVIVKDSISYKISSCFSEVRIVEQKSGKSFLKKYELMLTQPLLHTDHSKGKFEQRIFIFHKCFNKPVIFVTEGYDANYAESPNYNHELSRMFDANLIIVEHRYYGKSIPQKKTWDYLTIKQAATDHHVIANALQKAYENIWISTGTSKGGTTAIYHKALFPSDVAAVVAYVAPLTIAQEDPRPINFILNEAPSKTRKKIIAFQSFILKNKNRVVDYLNSFAKKHNVKYILPVETVVEYIVFEYAFSFWQFGISPERIPSVKGGIVNAINHLLMVVPPTTFVKDHKTSSFTYYFQAYLETGYYSFNEMAKRFTKYDLSATDYSNRVMADMTIDIIYRAESHKMIFNILNNKENRIIQIHGANDPWRYAAWEPLSSSNCLFLVAKGVAHNASYSDLSDEQKRKFTETMKRWTGLITK